jgi:hypothetical protein
MVWCGAALMDTSQLVQLLDQVTHEILALITVNLSWKSIVHEEVVIQSFGSGFCHLVPSGECLGISRKMVSHYQHITESTLGLLE